MHLVKCQLHTRTERTSYSSESNALINQTISSPVFQQQNCFSHFILLCHNNRIECDSQLIILPYRGYIAHHTILLLQCRKHETLHGPYPEHIIRIFRPDRQEFFSGQYILQSFHCFIWRNKCQHHTTCFFCHRHRYLLCLTTGNIKVTEIKDTT